MDSDLQSVVQRMSAYKNIIQDMRMRAGSKLSEQVNKDANGEDIISKYEQLLATLQNVIQKQTIVAKEYAQMEVWGNFEWKSINRLSEVGWEVKFFSCLDRQFDEAWIKD